MRNIYLSMFAIMFICVPGCHDDSRTTTVDSSGIALIHNFNCFNCNIGAAGWKALRDPKSVSILYTCLKGTTRQELANTGITALPGHLRTLEDTTLIKQVGDVYILGYPAVYGSKRDQLTTLTRRAASELFPEAQGMVQQIRPLLREREEMLYHVIWSGIMDGAIAWETLRAQLAKELGNAQVDLRTGWWLWPAHPYGAGTNSYGRLVITVLPGYPAPNNLQEEIEPVLNRLITSAVENRPIRGYKGLSKLTNYGLIDDKGNSRLFVIQAESPFVAPAMQLSSSFARNAFLHLDIKSLGQVLETSPKETLVIGYHELCYELLKMLSMRGELQIPDSKVSGGKDTFRLVSCYISGS